MLRRVIRDAEAGRNNAGCVRGFQGEFYVFGIVEGIRRILFGNFYKFPAHEETVDYKGYADEQW